MLSFRILVYCASQQLLLTSKCINALLKLICGKSFYSGPTREKEDSLNDISKSAHTLIVMYPCSDSEVSSPMISDFFLRHKDNSDPVSSVLENPNVSLMNVNASKAIFAVTPSGFDVHDPSKGAFFYHAQYKNCEEIIELPIHFMAPLAGTIPESEGKRAVLYNTGRCGSTLLIKMLTNVPGALGISEPDALFQVKNDSFQTRADILGAVVALQCKDSMASYQAVFLKPRSEANVFMEEMSVGSPDTKLIFMYRDPIKTIVSFYTMAENMSNKMFFPKLARFTLEASTHLPDVIDPELLANRIERSIANIDLVEFCTMQFVAHIAAYLHAKKWSQCACC